jgi:hypothetical protein
MAKICRALEAWILDLETCQPQAVEEGIGQIFEFHITAANEEGAVCREILLQPKQFRLIREPLAKVT